MIRGFIAWLRMRRRMRQIRIETEAENIRFAEEWLEARERRRGLGWD